MPKHEPYPGSDLPEPVIVWKDNTQLTEPLTHNQAFAWILRNQGQSVHYALTHGGYRLTAARHPKEHH